MIAHEHALQTTLLSYLVARPDVTIYGDITGSSDARVSTVSFRVAGWRSRDVVAAVETATNFGFRWGGFYSERLATNLLGLDEDGVVRVSMVHYNSGEFPNPPFPTLDKGRRQVVFVPFCPRYPSLGAGRLTNRSPVVDEVKRFIGAMDKHVPKKA
jgi:hypothetical protein